MYKSIVVNTDSERNLLREVAVASATDLPEHGLLVKVEYGAFNYHDALYLAGRLKSDKYPKVYGTDAVGTVVRSVSPLFMTGDEVIVTSHLLGDMYAGSFGGYISVPAELAIRVPIGMGFKEVITLGSAGLSAGLGALSFIDAGILPKSSCNVAIIDASFDCGAVATALFSKMGYCVTAYIGAGAGNAEYVKKLGAVNVKEISSADLSASNLITSPEYDAIFDTTGGKLTTALMNNALPNSLVVLAGSATLENISLPVLPFLRRGINLIGVNTLFCSNDIKNSVWRKLSDDWRLPYLDWICTEISLEDVEKYLPSILARQTKGRVIINHML